MYPSTEYVYVEEAYIRIPIYSVVLDTSSDGYSLYGAVL